MSDEREQDAAVIVAMQQHVENSDPAEMQEIYGDFTHAALRELDRLTAERDQAREQLAKLRSVIWSAYADLHSHLFTTVPVDAPNKMVEAYETLKASYESIRAALGIESEADHE